MAPLDLQASLGHVWQNVLYVLTGFAFGFLLERAGFGDARKLAAQFYLHEMRVLKVMFSAIITAMLLIFWTDALSILDFGKLYVNPTYLWSGILGGIIFGIGFVVGGYCPGTSLVSLSTLKIDGLFFVIGMMAGMFLFGETLPIFRQFWETAGFYGDITLFQVFDIPRSVVVLAVVIMAVLMFSIAEKTEKFFVRRKTEEE